MEINYQQIQQTNQCNWCRNPLTMSEGELTEANFVDIGNPKYRAVYCSRCLADEFRKRQPKSAINIQTGDEVNVEDINISGGATETTTTTTTQEGISHNAETTTTDQGKSPPQ